MLTTQDEQVLLALAPWADIAVPVVQCLARKPLPRQFDENTLCAAASLPSTQAITLLEMLDRMSRLGLVRPIADFRWERVADESAFLRIAPLLASVAYYKRVAHQDETTAEIVITRPGTPSALEEALNAAGFATGLMEVTSEAFGDLAASAEKSLTVMTPFLDAHGGRWLAGLLRKTSPDVRKTIVLRHLQNPAHDSYPDGIEALRTALDGTEVEVLDYLIPKSRGAYETFHAKVILADEAYAYVGSANLNRWSLEYSMELGVLLRGGAARRIAQIVDAIRKIARPA
jgi:phosphatidylserine/phosphatidylglycerophosphate/cardiolipin synthase-like enzyme